MAIILSTHDKEARGDVENGIVDKRARAVEREKSENFFHVEVDLQVELIKLPTFFHIFPLTMATEEDAKRFSTDSTEKCREWQASSSSSSLAHSQIESID